MRRGSGNRITNPLEIPSIGLGPVPKDEGLCTDVGSGVFECSIVPAKAGSERFLEVRVNGLEVTESARACSYVLRKQLQKTYQFWLLTFWVLTVPSALRL